MRDSIIPDALLDELPVLALRNSVLFPAAIVPVNVGRPRSVRLIEHLLDADRPTIGVVAQRTPDDEDPHIDELYPIGTVARLVKTIALGGGQYSVVLQGISRVRIVEGIAHEPFLRARAERVVEPRSDPEVVKPLISALRRKSRLLLAALPQPPHDMGAVIDQVQDAGALTDLLAAHLPIETDRKQAILAEIDLQARILAVTKHVDRQLKILRVKAEVADIAREQMSRSQRELLLRQQMRAIRRELGESADEDDALEELRERLGHANPPPEAERAARRELNRMSAMNSSSAEFQVAFNYVEWITDLPWSKRVPDRLDVAEARRVLDEDHHGLAQPKRRVVEYVAVRRLRADKKGPILCFLGPPGVGKTSLGRSIARATGRPFVRISLGGVHDEAEIRGHRRTYVGALPGRLVAALKKAGAINPVLVLDEVDKLGVDFSGDPASALLEALDPEQNSAFVDHYLNVPVDLSQVIFIMTANRRDTIPPPLLDRMEVIDLPGYTRDDKLAIARAFLVPRQLSDHGLTPEHVEVTDAAIVRLIDEHTDEAGVRQLERGVAALCRDVAVRVAHGETVRVDADAAFVDRVLGPPRRDAQRAEKLAQPGVAMAFIWTPGGGELVLVECSRLPGAGAVHLTGNMGGVLKEAATTALSYVRARAERFGVPPDFLDSTDLHVHLPKSSTPKDNPALGLSILTALVSALSGIRVRSDFAMTGEITLRGKVLRVEGLEHKILAAHHAGIAHVIVPRQNEADLEQIPAAVRDKLELHLVSDVGQVLELALVKPLPRPKRTGRRAAASI